ncbi:hypothetical protein niasHT_001163 [Heterodera trifolii]|uniref:FAM86 N-terminal domain-containing protein n=1 Tax=Heterodera trifolii TaxID=157864 RepID=A0ABD2LYL7_9BILA
MQQFPNLDALVFRSPASVRFPPKSEWFRALLKRLIGRMNEFQFDPSDVLYESLCASMTSDSEDGQHECFFRIFPNLFDSDLSKAPYILLKQRVQHISNGTTGLSCWGASFVLANFLTNSPHSVAFSNVSHALELGAGCGLVGISFAASNASAKVTLSDAHPAVLRQLRENVALNFDCSRSSQSLVSVERLDWTDFERRTLPKDAELIIAADVIFDPSLFPPFAQLLRLLLCAESVPGGVVALICCTVRDKSTVDHFLRIIENHNISVRAQYNCYFRNGIYGDQIAFRLPQRFVLKFFFPSGYF